MIQPAGRLAAVPATVKPGVTRARARV